MEYLMKLVADSFVRNGIETPAQDETPVVTPAEPDPTRLPNHNFEKKLHVEPAAT